MADLKLTELPELTTLAADDEVLVNDKSDTTDSPQGSSKRMSGANLLAGRAAASHTHAQSDVTGLVSDLAAKAPLASPTFTGTPAVPTAAPGTNTTQAASTAFVTAAVAAGGGGDPVGNGTINIVGIGDSNTARGMPGDRPDWQTEQAILLWAQMASYGKIRFTGQSALGGLTAAQIRTKCVPGVLTATRRPTHALVLAGINDLWSGGGLDLPGCYAAIEGIATDLLDGGVIPVLATLPGFATGGYASGLGLTANLLRVNAWIRKLAERRGLPLADFFEVCSDPAADPSVSTLRGTWRENYLVQEASDNVHPGGIGCQAMGEHLADVLSPQGAAGIALPMWNHDGVNLLTNGLNITDAGGNNIPDGWTEAAAGTGVTHSLITDAAIRGKWWRIQKTAEDGTFYTQTIPVTGGQIVRFTARIKINSIGDANSYFRCYLNSNSGAVLTDPNVIPPHADMVSAGQRTTLTTWYWFRRGADGGALAGEGLLFGEGVIPTGQVSAALNFNWFGTACDVQLAQISLQVFNADETPNGVA